MIKPSLAYTVATLVLLAGCMPTLAPSSLTSIAPQPAAEVPPLTGRVAYAPRRVQATTADILSAATVSLINTTNNETQATAVTDATGRFNMVFSGGFSPDPAVCYYLEASKGLNSNRAGFSAARLRTLVRFDGNSWRSITQPEVVVTATTTALAVAASLRAGSATPVDYTALIGSVDATTDAYTPVPNLTASDLTTVRGIVNQALLEEGDPVAGVGLADSNGFARLNQTIGVAGFSEAGAAPGESIDLIGSGFSPTPGDNVVRINGVEAVVTAATPTRLTVTVPSGVSSGPVTVTVGDLTIKGPNFQLRPVITAFSPADGVASDVITIDGSGFEPTAPASNVVTFNGVEAVVTSATATRLTARVPQAGTTGRIGVNSGGALATSADTFTVRPLITAFSPAEGVASDVVTIDGSGFEPTAPASNVVTFNGVEAVVTSATNTRLTARVPDKSGSGAIRVSVDGRTATSPKAFLYGTRITAGTTTYDSTYVAGEVFNGLKWVNSRNGSAWVNRELGGTYTVNEISMFDAYSDPRFGPATSILVRLRQPDGTWVTVDSYSSTNFIGEQGTAYRKILSTSFQATAFRLEMTGNGWFVGTDFSLRTY